jgi:intracellular sulfur oxidation DsrE/DsrF family protein
MWRLSAKTGPLSFLSHPCVTIVSRADSCMQLTDNPDCTEVNVAVCNDSWRLNLFQEYRPDAANYLKVKPIAQSGVLFFFCTGSLNRLRRAVTWCVSSTPRRASS